MADSHLPRSPFAGMADLGGPSPIRVLSSEEIAQMLASHRLYRETEYHEGHRADFSSVDLAGRNFSGLDLRGLKIDHAVLRGANFSGANLRGANLIGVIAEQARFDHADLSRARLSGANLVSASFENARRAHGGTAHGRSNDHCSTIARRRRGRILRPVGWCHR